MQVKAWAYQFREGEYPWCVCAVITYPRGNPAKRKIGFDLYSEAIKNKVHCRRIDAQRFENGTQIARLLTDRLRALDPTFDAKDAEQIERFAATILTKE